MNHFFFLCFILDFWWNVKWRNGPCKVNQHDETCSWMESLNTSQVKLVYLQKSAYCSAGTADICRICCSTIVQTWQSRILTKCLAWALIKTKKGADMKSASAGFNLSRLFSSWSCFNSPWLWWSAGIVVCITRHDTSYAAIHTLKHKP